MAGILLTQDLEARLDAEGHVLHLDGELLLHSAEVGLPVLVGDGQLLVQGQARNRFRTASSACSPALMPNCSFSCTAIGRKPGAGTGDRP